DFGTFVRSLDALSDAPFTFLLLLGLSLAARSLSERDARRGRLLAAGAGLALAAATLVRPISLWLLPLAALALVLARRPGRLARAAAFSLPCVLLVGGWAARNAARAGAFTLTPLSGSQPLFYFASAVQARVDGIPIPDEQERLGSRERYFRSGGATEREVFGSARYAELFPETSRLSLVELSRRWRARAASIVAGHPVLAAEELALFSRDLLLSPPVLLFAFQQGFYHPRPELLSLYFDRRAGPLFAALAREHPGVLAVAFVSIAQLVLVYVLFTKGVLSARPLDGRHVLLLVSLAYLVLVSAGTEAGDDRFRLPLMPLVCLYAGAGLARMRPASRISGA
ncbi:MAG TPA: hypothetical protein VKF32_00295, partial [Thermoanaerobaculia bacterium]|nr:hypothetical protein [Thermoanaerobaculia bacterium]